MPIQPLVPGDRIAPDRIKINANFTELDTKVETLVQSVFELEEDITQQQNSPIDGGTFN